jgi:hypothetical protein
MCTHHPACPAADAIDWWAARNITWHPGQGWTLLCNGAVVFDDHGALLADGRIAAMPDAPRTRLCSASLTKGGAHGPEDAARQRGQRAGQFRRATE